MGEDIKGDPPQLSKAKCRSRRAGSLAEGAHVIYWFKCGDKRERYDCHCTKCPKSEAGGLRGPRNRWEFPSRRRSHRWSVFSLPITANIGSGTDQGMLRGPALPPNLKILSADSYGSSAWSATASISAETVDGAPTSFFVKVSCDSSISLVSGRGSMPLGPVHGVVMRRPPRLFASSCRVIPCSSCSCISHWYIYIRFHFGFPVR